MDQDFVKNLVNTLIPTLFGIYGGKANFNIPILETLFANQMVKAFFIFVMVYYNTKGDVQLSAAVALIIYFASIFLINNYTPGPVVVSK